MSTLPTLYKKTSTGADQFWTIEANAWSNPDGAAWGVICTRWGQLNGAVQETKDIIKAGKNVGKKNETTPAQQAELEAQAQWEKKLKKGYVKSLDDARAGKVDAVIEGGVSPMLAHRFDEHGHKVVYPAFAQPKFDGHRCIAVIAPGEAGPDVTLWSRTRKPITGLPHLVQTLKNWAHFEGIKALVLDGELYNHDYRSKFEELTSFIRNPSPKPGHEAVQYHIYDLAEPNLSQANRVEDLRNFSARNRWKDTLVFVETIEVLDEDELMIAFERFLAQGYEGLMVRNAAGTYVNKRSYDLLKVKEFTDSEFKVVGVEEGRGKLAGHAIFVCETTDGTLFRAKMKGETAALKQYVEDPTLAVGKMLTVKFQGLTNKSGVPRFPVGLRFHQAL